MDDESYTLLAVRPDGGVPVVDLIAGGSRADALARARAFLAEHASCDRVEVWLAGRMVDEITRDSTARRPAGSRTSAKRL
jgi:hypothetical protein